MPIINWGGRFKKGRSRTISVKSTDVNCLVSRQGNCLALGNYGEEGSGLSWSVRLPERWLSVLILNLEPRGPGPAKGFLSGWPEARRAQPHRSRAECKSQLRKPSPGCAERTDVEVKTAAHNKGKRKKSSWRALANCWEQTQAAVLKGCPPPQQQQQHHLRCSNITCPVPLNQQFWGWGPAMCVATNPQSDSNAHSSLGTIVL